MVLVSILGDFHSSILPVLYEVKDKIKSHILIYDDFQRDVDKANNIIEGISKFKNKHNLNFKNSHYKIDEDSKNSISSLINIFNMHIDRFEDLYINTTDGHATINTLLSIELVPKGAKIIVYDRFDNHINLISKDNNVEILGISNVIPIKDHFLLRNIEVKSYEDKNFAEKYKDEIINIFKKYQKEFQKFKSYAFKNKILNEKGYSSFPNIAPLIKKMGLEDLNKNQVLITGGLFEFYIYLLLTQLDLDDIEVGMILHDPLNVDGYIPNEFDILFMKNNHLHMIECKNTSNYKLENLVFKYIALQDIIDEDSKMGMVLTNIGYKRNLNFKDFTKDMPYKRAYSKSIMIRGNIFGKEEEFLEDVKKHFNLR